jgi:hypothetical protein
MTPAELEAVIQRLQDAGPTSRTSRKRQILSSAREPIIALHQRGYSWRSLARELSTALGESISADLLRTACLQRRLRRLPRRSTTALPTREKLTSRANVAGVTPAPQPTLPPSEGRFGAKGLKL